ncbi:MAG TPA: hypothetical protein VLF15_07000, partial [Pseudoxanthomonas sp.]|nr:hypothetical protein [Pseudoxanthomonas sp.]
MAKCYLVCINSLIGVSMVEISRSFKLIPLFFLLAISGYLLWKAYNGNIILVGASVATSLL